MIAGVLLRPLRQIRDDRGAVFHWWRADDPAFAGFGEAYFSVVNPGAVKAWKRHNRMTMVLSVPVGRVRFVLYDDRPDSPTRGQVQQVVLGEDSAEYAALVVPPGLWNGFVGMASGPSLVGNCASIMHDPAESDRLPADSPDIPYRWLSGDLS